MSHHFAAAISRPAVSIIPPFHLHPIANDRMHQPICGDHQTRPQLGYASSIFTAAGEGENSSDDASFVDVNTDDATVFSLITFE